MKEILRDGEAFIERTWAGLREVEIQREELIQIDHICYRVETEDRYNELLEEFQEVAELVAVNKVNSRDIATLEFHEALQEVPYLELPAPKEGTHYLEGWEHVEAVTAGSLERFALRHSELPFSRDGMDKLINPELGLKVSVAMGMLVVKFHEAPLGAVARIEKNLAQQGINYDIRN